MQSCKRKVYPWVRVGLWMHRWCARARRHLCGGTVSELDPEAGWTYKKGDYGYGYKAHLSVDDEHGLIQATEATATLAH